jgi:hypothetical protein
VTIAILSAIRSPPLVRGALCRQIARRGSRRQT